MIADSGGKRRCGRGCGMSNLGNWVNRDATIQKSKYKQKVHGTCYEFNYTNADYEGLLGCTVNHSV